MGENKFNISDLERKISIYKEGEKTQVQPVWKRFNDLIQQMSDDQKAYVANHEVVVAEKQKMMQVFNEWIFEKHKNEFVLIPGFDGLAQGYVEAVASTAQEFGAKTSALRQENEDLKRELEALKSRLGGNTI